MFYKYAFMVPSPTLSLICLNGWLWKFEITLGCNQRRQRNGSQNFQQQSINNTDHDISQLFLLSMANKNSQKNKEKSGQKLFL